MFEWDLIVYTGGVQNSERCYSPNHEYYIVRLHTPIRALLTITLEPDFGTAKLYDKSGKLLYSGKTLLDFQAGPHWSAGWHGEKSSVFFMGNLGEEKPDGGWGVDLPTSPGDITPLRNCY